MTQFDQRSQQVDTQYNAGRDINLYPLSLTEQQRKRNRARMIERVQSIWIDGVLEPSVQGAAQIVLTLQNKPSAIVTPLWQVLREFDQTGPLPPDDTSIEQVYDLANGEVLILGEPGAGKTTLLLELTRALLERARQDETHPIPVVFSLSSWATRRQPLTEWLASELHDKYQVPLPLAVEWIKADQVLPLLDGLDEVAALHRAACVEAINTYRQAHGLLPTVVCSRQTDYLVLSTRLLLRTAVVVQPLTPEQIESYLTSGAEPLEELRQMLHKDADLQSLASTPLMLNVLACAYQGTSHEEITVTGSPETKQEQIFATYVRRVLIRRSTSTRYTLEQTTHWLSSLANQMKRRNQTIFYLEQMQPNWYSEDRFLHSPIIGLVTLISFILILMIGIVAASLLSSVVWKVIAVAEGLIFGVSLALSVRQSEIHPSEVIIWSWRGAQFLKLNMPKSDAIEGNCLFRLYFLFGIGNGIFIGLVTAKTFGWFAGVLIGIISALAIGFLTVLPDLLVPAELLTPKFRKPGQGIWHSLRNSFIVGSLRIICLSIGAGLFVGFIFGTYNGLAAAIILGFIPGLTRGILSGGTAWIQHFTLRFLLWRANCTPRNYPRFLDYATEHILLHKVGGGYIFLHRLLLDYFANLETGSGSDASLESRQERLPPDIMPSASVEPTDADK